MNETVDYIIKFLYAAVLAEFRSCTVRWAG